jgi:DNA-binding transcriptional MerR regulator
MAGPGPVTGDVVTIDELAQRTGTPTSTFRLYQSRGLLPGPTREGRVGYHRAQHLMNRMRLIAQLQDDGFAGIGRLLEAWPEGRGLDEVMGFRQGGLFWFPGEIDIVPLTFLPSGRILTCEGKNVKGN